MSWLREGLANWISGFSDVDIEGMSSDEFAGNILAFLHSQGVVLKIEKERPPLAYQNEDRKEEEMEIYDTAQAYMEFHGWVPVEPLIGE